MSLLRPLTVTLIAIYALLTGVAGLQQLRAKRIQGWAALLMVAGAFGLLAAGSMLASGSPYALFVLLGSLLLLHALAVNNGLTMNGRINLRHHLVRAFITIVLFALAYFAQR
jgi:hypothetical protein